MAIKPKTATLQIRIDPDLLERFQSFSADRELVPSELVRRWIRMQVEDWEKQASRASAIQSKGVGATQPEKIAPRAGKRARGVH
jgi:hypothetical protein